MANPFSPAELIEFSKSTSGSRSFLSAQILDAASRSSSKPELALSGNFLYLDNPFNKNADSPKASDVPLISTDMRNILGQTGRLSFSTPVDNQSVGVKPDFKLVLGTDGKLRLEPTGQRNPLAAGGVNIELDTKNKSLVEAIKNADKNLKEYVREMMVYWIRNHPGQAYPDWWQDILASEPDVPQDGAPVPVEPTPQEYKPQESPVPEPPAAPANGWQPDYRNGGGPGYNSGDNGNSGARPSYYHGGGRGNEPDYAVPNAVPNFDDKSGFIDRLSNVIMSNEGSLNSDGTAKFDTYTPDDNGGISVGLRQWHAGGALPELLHAWQEKDANKFQEYFNGMSPAQINAMSSAEFNSHPELVTGMKSALADKEYQGVQSQLMNDWVKREVKMGIGMGLTTEKEIATYVDIANQYGQNSADSSTRIGSAHGDQAREMNESIRGGQYAERFALIDKSFSDQPAQLQEQTPVASQFGKNLASAVVNVQNEMGSSGGKCAAAVQMALDDVGLPQFLGSGNAWDMLGPLERSGKFVQVPESQATVGDLIVRSWSKETQAENGGRNYGDISVVTGRNGDSITQTNDLSYEYQHDNPRYGETVFLRYVGDQKKENQNKASEHESVASAQSKNPHSQASEKPSTQKNNEGGNKSSEQIAHAGNKQKQGA